MIGEMPGKCSFQLAWLKIDKYALWLSAADSKHSAKCTLCAKTFDIGNMGEHGLKSHMEGKKHMALVKAKRASSNIAPKTVNIVDTAVASGSGTGNRKTETLCAYVSGSDCLDAEIRWAVKCAVSNYSFNSCFDVSDLFKEMFPDSNIAKKFSCGSTKTAYLMCFGLAPYFKSCLLKCIDESNAYTLMFDETLNETLQTKQMDVHIRFWHPNEQQVSTKYITSVFLGHGKAEDILKAFSHATKDINLSKVVQVSMDGPAVNKKFYNMFEENLKKEFSTYLINIGTCSLHTLNNSFKHGAKASMWKIDELLSSLYYLFKDTPARREDYMVISNTKKFPKKFCHHRWLENIPAVERAIEIWSDIKDFIKNISKGKFSKPNCKSFYVVEEACKDQLMLVKLQVFLAAAKLVTPLLEKYQKDSPLLPFLAGDIKKFVLDCSTVFRIIKNDVLGSVTSVKSIIALNFLDKSMYADVGQMSLGFAGDRLLRQNTFKNIPPANELKLKKECQSFISTMLHHVTEKSPINVQFVRDLACLDPRKMAKYYDECISKFKRILSILIGINKLDEKICDSTILEYSNFLLYTAAKSADFSEFDPVKQPLDLFLKKHIDHHFKHLWNVCQILLIFSHGQAVVERGFSTNKQMEVENLKEETYVAKRIIKQHINSNFAITKELRSSAASARQRYLAHLEEQKKLKAQEVSNSKRKYLEDDLADLKSKKAHLERTISHLTKSADELALRAENERDFNLVSESNSFRKSSYLKAEEVKMLDIKIQTLSKEIDNM